MSEEPVDVGRVVAEAYESAGFIEPKPPKSAHRCELPQSRWEPGLMWVCSDLHLWVIRGRPSKYRNGYTVWGLEWWPASWWQRVRVRLAGRWPVRPAELFMATDEERRQPTQKPQNPPRGPSGVSPKPGGTR
jgi:hypothetical protein